jgi:tetratricopeptide (TPR) repeat protein
LAHLVMLLEDCGDEEGAKAYLLRLLDSVKPGVWGWLEAKGRTGQDIHPQLALDLNNQALRLRKLGRCDEAAAFLRRAIVLEDRLLPANDPKRAHRRNNLAGVCLAGGQLEQAMLANAEAWRLKAGQHDLTSGRILFTRVALCWLCHADAKLYPGQLKTLLAQAEVPCLGGVDPKWDAKDVLEYLGSKLPADAVEFLSALFEVLNDLTKLPNLGRFEQWRRAAAMPLDAPWPRAPC